MAPPATMTLQMEVYKGSPTNDTPIYLKVCLVNRFFHFALPVSPAAKGYRKDFGFKKYPKHGGIPDHPNPIYYQYILYTRTICIIYCIYIYKYFIHIYIYINHNISLYIIDISAYSISIYIYIHTYKWISPFVLPSWNSGDLPRLLLPAQCYLLSLPGYPYMWLPVTWMHGENGQLVLYKTIRFLTYFNKPLRN